MAFHASPTIVGWQKPVAASVIALAILALWPARHFLAAEHAIWVIVGVLAVSCLLAPSLGNRPEFRFCTSVCCAGLLTLALILLIEQLSAVRISASHLNAAVLCLAIGLIGGARLWAEERRLPVSQLVVSFPAGIAILVLLGWYLNSALIVQGATSFVPMQFNTALCHLLSAVWLWRALNGQTRYAAWFAIPIVVFSLAALLEENNTFKLGLDELLWVHSVVKEGVPAGRMASITAVSFLLGVIAMLLLSNARRTSRVLIGVWTCGLAICISAFIVVGGYLLDVPEARVLGTQTPMAFMTALAFCGQGVALVFAGHEGADRDEHQTYWLPILVIIGSIVLAEQLGVAVREQRLVLAEQVTQLRADRLQNAISRGMSLQLSALLRMAERLSLVDPSVREGLFETDARLLFKDFPALQTLALIGTDKRFRRIYQRGAQGSVLMPGLRFGFERQRLAVINAVAATGEAQLSAPVVLLGNHPGSVYVMPLHSEDEALNGAAYLSAAIQFSTIEEEILLGLDTMQIQVWDGETLVVGKGPPGQNEPVHRTISLHGRVWDLRLWESQPFLDRLSWALILGTVIAGLWLAQALRYAGLAASRAKKSDLTSGKLRQLSELAIRLSGHNTGRTAEQLVEQLREALNAQQATLAIKSEGSHPEVTLVAVSEQRALDVSRVLRVEDIKAKFGEPRSALRKGRAQLRSNPGETPSATTHAGAITSLLAAPLIGRDGGSVGHLYLCDRSGGDFDADDEAICVQFAQLAAAAIERQRLLARLQERDRFFEMALEPFCILNPEVTHFLQVNPAFVRLLGYPEEELLSRPFIDFVAPGDHVPTRDIARDVVEQGAIKDFVNRYRCADGSLVALEWDSVKDDQGLVYAVARNVTERIKAEKTLRQAAEDLRAHNRELQDFAFVASHDLQEPLRKIRAFGERLERHAGDLNSAARDDLTRINAAAARMQTLIENLLSFSQVNTRGRPFVRVDLNQIVAVVLEDLSERVRTSQAQVDVAALPCVDGDATQLRQVMQNLIGNALKFSAADRAPLVRVQWAPAELRGQPAVAISVVDNGIGFDQKHQERIFAPFQRLHTTTEYPGTGIGLAIVRRIVQRHQGRIDAHGQPGLGATFTLILPERLLGSETIRVE